MTLAKNELCDVRSESGITVIPITNLIWRVNCKLSLHLDGNRRYDIKKYKEVFHEKGVCFVCCLNDFNNVLQCYMG